MNTTDTNTNTNTSNTTGSRLSPDTMSLLKNATLYQVGWFAVVLGAAWGAPGLGAMLGIAAIAVHVVAVKNRRVELERIAAAVLIGTVVELLNARLGIYQANSGVVWGGVLAPWLLVIWAGFATAFYRSLRWLHGHTLLAIPLGAVAGPLAFWGGERMGAISMTREPLLLGVLAVQWAVALPLLVWVSERLAARRAVPMKAMALTAAAAAAVALTLVPAVAHADSPSLRSANKVDLESNCAEPVAQRQLQIRGEGSYEYLGFIDVMDAALYDEAPRRSESVLGPVSKCLVIRYKRDFDAKDFADVTIKGIAQNVSPEELKRLMPRIERFNLLYRDVQEGDRYALSFVPGVGTVLSYNGTARGTVEGADFAAALFSIWLGSRPMDDDLRAGLLGSRRA